MGPQDHAGVTLQSLQGLGGLFLLHTANSTPRSVNSSRACWFAVEGSRQGVGELESLHAGLADDAAPERVVQIHDGALGKLAGQRLQEAHPLADQPVQVARRHRQTHADPLPGVAPAFGAGSADQGVVVEDVDAAQLAQGLSEPAIERLYNLALGRVGLGVEHAAPRRGRHGAVVHDHRRRTVAAEEVQRAEDLRRVGLLEGQNHGVGLEGVQSARRAVDFLGPDVELAQAHGEVDAGDEGFGAQQRRQRLDGVGTQDGQAEGPQGQAVAPGFKALAEESGGSGGGLMAPQLAQGYHGFADAPRVGETVDLAAKLARAHGPRLARAGAAETGLAYERYRAKRARIERLGLIPSRPQC